VHCAFAPCFEPGIVDALRTWDHVFVVERTIALALWERHAEALRDELSVLAKS